MLHWFVLGETLSCLHSWWTDDHVRFWIQ